MDPLDEARRLSQNRRHEQAIPLYEEAVARAPSIAARATALTELAGEYQLVGRLADGLGIAEDALEMAARAGDPLVEARARLTLATLLLYDFQAGAAETHRPRAMELLDGAAQTFERHGSLDFAAVLFTMAQTALMTGELPSAERLYRRLLAVLDEPRWAKMADHVAALRQEARAGLAAMGRR